MAKMLGVVALSQVEAHFKVTRWRKSGLKVIADISADVIQNCVVSLETISSSLNEQFEWVFQPATRPRKEVDKDAVLLIDPLGEDAADLLIDGRIDLGQLLSEHLCLMIDPFIRSENIEFDALYQTSQKLTAPETSNVSPFAVLKQIGKKP
jgi:uncharacterized metal-binding protein YceD (DUF177 family)